MTRGQSAPTPDVPERRCIVTGESQPRGGLLRFVVGPGDVVVPDIEGKLPGRGFYVSLGRAELAQAVTKKLFSRAARQQVSLPQGVTTPEDLPNLIEALLLKRVIGLISLANKAGQGMAGYEKARELLLSGRARALIQASDGSERGKTKLKPPPNGNYIGCLTASEIGLAFGREHVIHAALAAGGLASRVVEEAAKLARLRERDGGVVAAAEDRRNG